MLSCQETPPYLICDSAFADELSTDSLGWDGIPPAWSPIVFITCREPRAVWKCCGGGCCSPSVTEHHRGTVTKADYDPHAHDSLVCQLLHTTNHSAVTGSVFITTADGQPSERANNEMSLEKKGERASERTAEKVCQGGNQNSQ